MNATDVATNLVTGSYPAFASALPRKEASVTSSRKQVEGHRSTYPSMTALGAVGHRWLWLEHCAMACQLGSLSTHAQDVFWPYKNSSEGRCRCIQYFNACIHHADGAILSPHAVQDPSAVPHSSTALHGTALSPCASSNYKMNLAMRPHRAAASTRAKRTPTVGSPSA